MLGSGSRGAQQGLGEWSDKEGEMGQERQLSGSDAGARTSSFPLFLCQGYVLRGWVDLSSDKPHTVKKSIKYLEHGLQDTRDVLGLMGKVGSGEAGVAVSPARDLSLSASTRWVKSRGPERVGSQSRPGPAPVLPAFCPV